MCPISFMRMEVPARGRDCLHIQCFDLSAYLSSNQRMASLKKRWQCAVCSRIIKPSDLVVDSFNMEVLKGTAIGVESVVLDENGKWSIDAQVDGETSRDKLQTMEPQAVESQLEVDAVDHSVVSAK